MLVNIWTDGACSGNPGPGGFAAILVAGERRKEVVGGKCETTNNEVELLAILAGLAALSSGPHEVVVHTDSQLAVGWLSNGWKRKAEHLRPILNHIDRLAANHNVSFEWVKGHNGDRMNERADALAHGAVERYR